MPFIISKGRFFVFPPSGKTVQVVVMNKGKRGGIWLMLIASLMLTWVKSFAGEPDSAFNLVKHLDEVKSG